MLKKSVRSAVTWLAAGSVALSVAIAQPLLGQAPARAATSTATLFAITRLQQLLVKVDPATGALTQVTSLFPNCSGTCPVDSQSFELASDPTTHRLFAERFEVLSFDFPPVFQEELVTIDSQTGAILSQPQFTGRAPGELAFDTSSHTLFGFSGNEIVKVDPATATVTPFASVGSLFGVFQEDMAISSATHTIYVSVETGIFPPPPSPSQVFAVDTMTGQVSPGVGIDTPIRSIATDGASLIAIPDMPFGGAPQPIRIDPTTGATTLIGGLPTTPGGFMPTRPTVDPSTHTLFVDVSISNGGPFQDSIFSINDQTGVSTSAPLLTVDNLSSMIVEAPPPITAESIKADVRSALAGGGIDSAGIALSLLAKLNAAADARAAVTASASRSSNGCATAAAIYQAFINEVTAQSNTAVSGVRPHITATTANQLISEAQFLIANCP